MWEAKQNTKEIGYVVRATDYLLHIEGLPSARMNDVVVDADGNRALVSALHRERIEALMLDHLRPKPGHRFELAPMGLQVSFSEHAFGRAFNPLGRAIDGGMDLPKGGKTVDLDTIAPGIDYRKIISEQFYTGISVIDILLPIGVGQRELMFGPPGSGKSSFILTMIANQKGKGIICIYVPLGKSEIEVKAFTNNLKKVGASDYTMVVAATSSEPAPMIAIAPAIAFTVAENFQQSGKRVFLILDDLGTQAKYAREIGLLSGQIPGRESYPADLFYQYSRNIERAGNFTDDTGGGSITLLPVIETDLENITGYVPTTLMSITDGHLLSNPALKAQGVFPAIDPERSVTRVGHQTQTHLLRVVADKVRALLINFHELERFSSFGSELSAASQVTIKKGAVAAEFLKQEPLEYIDPGVQILMLSLVFTPFYDNKDIDFTRKHKKVIISTFSSDEAFASLRSLEYKGNFDELLVALQEKFPVLEKACT